MIRLRTGPSPLGCALGAAVLSLALGIASGSARAADPSQFSRAEKLVFVEHQLANVKAPLSLRYTFVKSGSLEPGFEDEVALDVRDGGKAGSRAVQGRFLSGEREIKLPEIPDAEANPVILFFLERDIREMERLTKGKPMYFHRRIAQALAEAATVRDITVKFGGKDATAQEVSVVPYAQDALRSRFERYADKRYTFVLSKDVPGGVYQIRTLVGGETPSGTPGLEEVLTLASAAPSSNQPSRKP